MVLAGDVPMLKVSGGRHDPLFTRRRGLCRLGRPQMSIFLGVDHAGGAYLRGRPGAGRRAGARRTRRPRARRSSVGCDARPLCRLLPRRRSVAPRPCSTGMAGTASAPIAAHRAQARSAGWRRECESCNGAAFPARRSRRDHGRGRRRALPSGSTGALRARHVLRAGRVPGARRDHRGRRSPRDPRGGRRALLAGRLSRVTALALPLVADDRLLCQGRQRDHHGRPHGAGGCPLVLARRSCAAMFAGSIPTA